MSGCARQLGQRAAAEGGPRGGKGQGDGGDSKPNDAVPCSDEQLEDSEGVSPAELAAKLGHWECVEAMGRVVASDRSTFMHHRLAKEIDRQKSMLRKKEIFFGRSLMQVEGGHEFTVRAGERRVAGGAVWLLRGIARR